MDERSEDDDREVLAGLSSLPPHRKAHSYSQQLRSTSTHQQLRKHSLDEKRTHINIGSFYNSYDDNDFSPDSSTKHTIAGGDNYMSQTGDSGGNVDDLLQCQPLPEFIGNGGGIGIFKVPIRSAVHPGRPPYLELRPHPLRETQAEKFLRNIACTEAQLWAGQESGLRVWEFHNAFQSGCGLGGRVRRGDEDAVPFYESAGTTPIICLAVDNGNRLVWSGHKDGKIIRISRYINLYNTLLAPNK